jgi:hypothetical protein
VVCHETYPGLRSLGHPAPEVQKRLAVLSTCFRSLTIKFAVVIVTHKSINITKRLRHSETQCADQYNTAWMHLAASAHAQN